jgi:hypothetical protein
LQSTSAYPDKLKYSALQPVVFGKFVVDAEIPALHRLTIDRSGFTGPTALKIVTLQKRTAVQCPLP